MDVEETLHCEDCGRENLLVKEEGSSQGRQSRERVREQIRFCCSCGKTFGGKEEK